MGIEWELPDWRKQGRTGPGPAAPKYKKLSDRNKVRKGKPVGKDQFGDGGTRRIPASKIKASKSGGGGGNKKKGCCSYVEAGKAIRRRKFRLAARYVRLDVKRRLSVA